VKGGGEMQAERYLEQIKKLDAIILNKRAERKRWESIADSMGGFSVGDRVQASRNLHKGSDAIAEYLDIDTEIKALTARKKAILDTLQRLPCDEYKVLYKIYVEGKMLKELPSEFYKSYEWCKKKKQRGLLLLQNILDERDEA
jgi:DNA-directed RNA polymerase specialized sigma24 family protein